MSSNESKKMVFQYAKESREAKQFPMIEPGVEQLSDYFNRTGTVIRPSLRHGAGLKNPRCDCFLNSILQLVVHTPQLAGMIVETSDKRVCRGRYPCPHCELRKHIIRATSSPRPFVAVTVQRLLPLIFPAHIHGYQEDAHEMLTLLFDALDPPPGKKFQAPDASRMEKLMAQSTPIQQILGGCLKNEITCGKCTQAHVNFERVLDLNLGLPASEDPMTFVSIKDLLEANFKEEQIDSFHCDRCNAKGEANKKSSILRAPSVLILQLKRFDVYGNKNRLPVTPDIALQLGGFMGEEKSKQAHNYRLQGVVEHIGVGLESGHYISAMRGFDRLSWYCFDDSNVTPWNDQWVQRMEPYLVVYTKWDEQDGERTFAGRPSFTSGDLCQAVMKMDNKRCSL